MDRSKIDSYRPQYGADAGPPPLLPAAAQDALYHFQGNGSQADSRGDGRRCTVPDRPPRQFKFRAPPPPSERPLFTQGFLQESSELTFGGDQSEDKFRNLDDLTDTDEADMDVSVNDDDDDEDQDESQNEKRPAKRARINEQGDAAKSLPKWSNPDPYTVLPPPEQKTHKKTNVVNLIRKARNIAALAEKNDSGSNNDDFISFDFDAAAESKHSLAPLNAPIGPSLGTYQVKPHTRGKTTRDLFENAPGVNPTSTLGKRSRDLFEDSPSTRSRDGQQQHPNGCILPEWRADADCNPTPWVKNTATPTKTAGLALHKEIIDFYDWVQPRDFEAAVRRSVLDRLEKALVQINPGGKLEAFGSYAANLYLPVGDMDLVFLERTFRSQAAKSGPPEKPSRNLFERTAQFVRQNGIARPGSVNAIWFAKVPIITFVDDVSGLKVDLSFNNTSGVTANQTFQVWREQYPAMPIITSIIKQFLMLRGLNNVFSGGLGGFSVISLVTSLIQHMPSTKQPANLGQILVEFFNFYGKLFNRQQVAIRLDPPGYLDAASYRPFQFNHDKPGRLKIIDPNRPENNISGGTNKIGLILDCFATAHDILQDCMAAYEQGHGGPSFLEHIVGGNFRAYDTQRDFLRVIYISSPELPAAAVHPMALPPNGNKLGEMIKRLQRLRPALAERAENAANMQDLASIGGYPHVDAMLKDLSIRDRHVPKVSGTTPPALLPVKHRKSSILADAKDELEWIRARLRRFLPDIPATIDSCTSKKGMANTCGYDEPSLLFSQLANWEKKNGLLETTKQEKAALDLAASDTRRSKYKITEKGIPEKGSMPR